MYQVNYEASDAFWDKLAAANGQERGKPLDPVKLAIYQRHVADDTVPTGWRKLLTTTGIESYRHKSVMDDYKPDPEPVYPSWTRKQALRSYPPEIPTHTGGFTSVYVREFNKLNHYK